MINELCLLREQLRKDQLMRATNNVTVQQLYDRKLYGNIEAKILQMEKENEGPSVRQ